MQNHVFKSVCGGVWLPTECRIKSKLAFRTSQDLYKFALISTNHLTGLSTFPYISDPLASLLFSRCAESFPTAKPLSRMLFPHHHTRLSPLILQVSAQVRQCSSPPDPKEGAPCSSATHFFLSTHRKLFLFLTYGLSS